MSVRGPSSGVAEELNRLFIQYLRDYPDDRPVTHEKYLDYLKENASHEAYQYSVDSAESKELIS